MIIHIHDNLTIADLQERFTKCFPNLKIEFYSKPHHYKELTPENLMYKSDELIGNLKKDFDQGELEIKSWDKAFNLEKSLRDKFGLNVQVFRNANGKWLQTSETDKYTLSELNEMSQQDMPDNGTPLGEPIDLFDSE